MCGPTDTNAPKKDLIVDIADSDDVPELSASKNVQAAAPSSDGPSNLWYHLTLVFGTTTLLLLIAEIITITLAASDNNNGSSSNNNAMANIESAAGVVYVPVPDFPTVQPPSGENPCAGKKPNAPNVECVIDQIGEQAGANVTKGYNGSFNTSAVPLTVPYWQAGMCPVNVHWHLGAEHFSAGEFDADGSGPTDIHDRRQLAGKTREGFQCSHYNEADPKFTTEYAWKHCVGMEVGQTYEVHWPHSAAGACGTLNQYQTPFYDGVFCTDGVLSDTAGQIGVQAQVFTVVNDERYFYPDLMRGMIVDGDKGMDLAMYTGSTTGTSRDNEICSQYTPITWQVDRKCHVISASTFDKMCADMKAQRDDMSDDLYAHGSRELVADHLAANNHANLRA